MASSVFLVVLIAVDLFFKASAHPGNRFQHSVPFSTEAKSFDDDDSGEEETPVTIWLSRANVSSDSTTLFPLLVGHLRTGLAIITSIMLTGLVLYTCFACWTMKDRDTTKNNKNSPASEEKATQDSGKGDQ